MLQKKLRAMASQDADVRQDTVEVAGTNAPILTRHRHSLIRCHSDTLRTPRMQGCDEIQTEMHTAATSSFSRRDSASCLVKPPSVNQNFGELHPDQRPRRRRRRSLSLPSFGFMRMQLDATNTNDGALKGPPRSVSDNLGPFAVFSSLDPGTIGTENIEAGHEIAKTSPVGPIGAWGIEISDGDSSEMRQLQVQPEVINPVVVPDDVDPASHSLTIADVDDFSMGSLMDEISDIIVPVRRGREGINSHGARHSHHLRQKTAGSLWEQIQLAKWEEVLQVIEEDPDQVRYREKAPLFAERTVCFPIHLALTRKSVPLYVVDALFTIHPNALAMGDAVRKQTPLHIGVLSGVSLAVLEYLCQACPAALGMEDFEGNVPLHYAAEFSSGETMRLISSLSPSFTFEHANFRKRLPLHLVSARCWDDRNNSLSSDIVQQVLSVYPQGAQQPDRNGRLPVHLACDQNYPQWEILRTVVEAYPEGLLVRDNLRQLPVQLLKRWLNHSTSSACGDNDVLFMYLNDLTQKEKRNSRKWDKRFSLKFSDRRKNNRKDDDLMNCYG